MYYLIDYKTAYGGFKKKTAFENFKDVKDEVERIFYARGWSDYKSIDFRSLKSCLDFIFRDAQYYTVKKSISYKKFLEYRYQY